MDKLEKPLLKKLILEALSKLYDNDCYLINKDNVLNEFIEGSNNHIPDWKKHAAERAIVFRFGIYLQELMYANKCLEDYHLDCEYNRKLDSQKDLGDRLVYPDLIIHKRGNMKENLLVMEIKTWWNYNTENDEKKLKDFVDPKKEYKYKFGLSIIIEKNYPPNLKWIPEESSEV